MIKVQHVVSQRFGMKKTTIAEMHDLKTLKLDELMGSLRQYEMEVTSEKPEKKTLNLAFKSEILNKNNELYADR